MAVQFLFAQNLGEIRSSIDSNLKFLYLILKSQLNVLMDSSQHFSVLCIYYYHPIHLSLKSFEREIIYSIVMSILQESMPYDGNGVTFLDSLVKETRLKGCQKFSNEEGLYSVLGAEVIF